MDRIPPAPGLALQSYRINSYILSLTVWFTFGKFVPIFSALMTESQLARFKGCTLGTNVLRLAHSSQPPLLAQENFRKHKWMHTLCSAAASLLQYTCIRTEVK